MSQEPTPASYEQTLALAAIHAAGREIAASLDLDSTLHLVMRRAAEILPMDAGAILFYDEEKQLHRVITSHNLPQSRVREITFASDEGVPGWVVRHRQPLIIDDTRLDERVHPAVRAAGVLSVLAIPLIAREEVVGVLNLFCERHTHAFDGAALQLAQVFADQTAIGIQNAQLVSRLRHATAVLEERVEERTRQLEETQARVVRAEKMAAVGRLAASVAHEINNPLQAIGLNLQLLHSTGLEPKAEKRLCVVQGEVDRIGGIVQRLLDFQRPRQGVRQPQDVAALLDDVLALAGKQIQQAGVQVMKQVAPALPPVIIVSDHVKQVFLNLILNAIDAMPDGGELAIWVRLESDHVRVCFQDTGMGIPEEVLPQLFEPFFTTKHDGSGLGLAISHEIVVEHGGTLTATSRPEGGAIFNVRLPLVPVVGKP